ncbi:MAG: type III-A CRISPR-associated protein Cas10/Csm1 [Vallitalea sp.]|nr:type III-A CRISPR-associated protein Cas10/Csm1 [Vallitalea sp.]
MNTTQNKELEISRKDLYYSALFHDIGKYIRRGVLNEYKELHISSEELIKYSGNKAHASYSATFTDKFLDNTTGNVFKNLDKDSIIKLVLNHHSHRDNNILEKYQIEFNNKLSNELLLLMLSDWLSASERDYEETLQNKPQKSIFSNIRIDNKANQRDDKYYYIKRMDLVNNSIFPEVTKEHKYFKYNKKEKLYFYPFYKKQFGDFVENYKKINKEQQLSTLMERYFTTAPSAYFKSVPDISLYDHTKTTAAIAVCLYEQFQASQLSFEDIEKRGAKFNNTVHKLINNTQEKQFIFINGDLSGIQEFIFDIKDKKNDKDVKNSAKKVKLRSSYISLIMDVIANYIIRELKLEQENLLFSSGGNFYILAPYCMKDEVNKLIEDIATKLLGLHKGELYCAIDYLELTFSDFMNFNKQWKILSDKTQRKKSKKWLCDGNIDIYEYFFNPNSEYINKHNIINEICNNDKMLSDIIKTITKSNYIVYEYSDKENKEGSSGLNTIFNEFNTNLIFMTDINNYKKNHNSIIYKINDFDISDRDNKLINADKFTFRTYKLPTKSITNENTASFDDLAKLGYKSVKGSDVLIGDDKLAYVKIDVDNLGQLFRDGFKKVKVDDKEIENKTISRVTTLSRMINIFFECYIQYLVDKEYEVEEDNKKYKKKLYKNKIYILYSGGDDTLLIGSWNIVLDFISLVNDEFRKYTCNNTDITISGAVKIYNPKYPIARVMPALNDEMDFIKNYIRDDEVKPTKNKICIMGQPLTWDELKVIIDLKKYLVKSINYSNLSRNNLQKLFLVNDEITKGTKKIWKLYYYLRNVNQECSDKVIKIYEKILFNKKYNLIDGNELINIYNKQVLNIAVKMAEIETRRQKENK